MFRLSEWLPICLASADALRKETIAHALELVLTTPLAGEQASVMPNTRAPRLVATWTDETEAVLKDWIVRLGIRATAHRNVSERLSRRSLSLGLPLVILSSVVSTSVFTTLSSSKIASVGVRAAVGAVTALVTVLGALQTFLRLGERSEAHRITANRMEGLLQEVDDTLALPRDWRAEPRRYLDGIRKRMEKITDESPPLPEILVGRIERVAGYTPRWRRAADQLRKPPRRKRRQPEPIDLPSFSSTDAAAPASVDPIVVEPQTALTPSSGSRMVSED
jgi:hypothetical protein